MCLCDYEVIQERVAIPISCRTYGLVYVMLSKVCRSAWLSFSCRCFYPQEDVKFLKVGAQGDIWLTGMGDIPAGRFVVGFQAVAPSGKTRPAVAIDDVELLEGTCEEQGNVVKTVIARKHFKIIN